MSFRERIARINRRGHLCVGLDPQPELLPHHVDADRDGIGRFLGAIIEATSPYAVAYKPNSAFYEALGPWGWEILESLREVVPSDKFLILDAKRGDVGHTAQRYAHTAFQRIGADAVTLSPYLGEDALEPFLQEENRGIFLLCLTSNPGAEQWQTARVEGEPLFCRVARWAADIDRRQNIGLVAGATRPASIAQIRAAAAELPLLIPGIGAQKGDLSRTLEAVCGAPFLISASRSITCASRERDFADAAAEAAAKLHREIQNVEASLVGS